MKKRVLLIAVLAAALILPFVVAEKAGADAIMFPWITKSQNVATLVTVVNTAQGDPDFEERLHFQYWYKDENGTMASEDVNDAENTCTEQDFKVLTSKDDMVTFDASGQINGGLALFNDTKTVPVNPATHFAMTADAPRRAFLLVDNNTSNNFASVGTNTDGTLYGEAMVIEVTTGAAWGYIAYNAAGGQTSSQSDPVYFLGAFDVLGEVIGNNEYTQTILLPANTVTTRFFLTPVDYSDSGDHGTLNQRVGNANTQVQLCLDTDPVGNCNEGGIFDNDEGPVSGAPPKDIVCTSADDLSELLGGAWDTFQDSNRSGWGYVVTHDGTVNRTGDLLTLDNSNDEMIIGRLDFTTSGLTLDGFEIPTVSGVEGGINNFIWLRDNERWGGNTFPSCGTNSGGINCIHNEPYSPRG